MARPKKDANLLLTPEQQDIQFISSQVVSSDKISWQRKYNNLQKLVEEVNPLEEEIGKLTAKCQPLYDEIAELRKLMVEECIHPSDMLIHKGDHIECKFCLKSIVINKTN